MPRLTISLEDNIYKALRKEQLRQLIEEPIEINRKISLKTIINEALREFLDRKKEARNG